MAEDSAGFYLAKLFSNTCVQNDDPDKIRAWAADHTLQKVTDPATRLFSLAKARMVRPGRCRPLPGICAFDPWRHRWLRRVGARG
jgi:hypothetical protein